MSARVLCVTDVAGIGGSERRLLHLAAGLRGVDPSFCVLGASGPLIDRLRGLGREAIALDLRGGADNARVLARLIQLARRSGASIVHGQNRTAAFLAAIAGRAIRAPGVVATRTYTATGTGGRHAFLDRATSATVDVTIAVSEAARDALRSEGVPERKLRLIPNGVDQAALEIAAARAARRPGSRLVVSVGNLHPVKGHEVLVRAMRRVIHAHGDARLAIVGEGTLRGELAALAARLGIEDRVELLGFQASVAEQLGGAACFVLPSLDEGMSNALLEAMAIGLPAIATRVGGNTEVVDHPRSGLLVPPGDPDALAEAIMRVLGDPNLADALGEAAASRVRERYSLAAMLRSYESLYGELLARS